MIERLLGLLREVRASEPGLEALSRVFRYILTVTKSPGPHRMVEALRFHMDESTAQEFKSLAEQLEERGLERGIEKGIERGIEKGIEKGTREALQRILAKRFGPISAALAARIDALTGDALRDALDRALTATTAGEVIG